MWESEDLSSIQKILDRTVAGERLGAADALVLMERADLDALGRAALAVRRRMHPQPIAT